MQDIHISVVTISYIFLCYKKFRIHMGNLLVFLKHNTMCYVDDKANNQILPNTEN